jgi:hypothetical protein
MEIPNIPGQAPVNTPEPETPPVDLEQEKTELPVQPPAEKAADKESSSAPVEETVEAVVAVPQKKKSLIPSSILTKEAKTQLVLEKKETLRQVQLLKQIAFLFLILSIGWFLWLQMNLSETNTILSFVGVKQNMGQEIKVLKKEKIQVGLEEKKAEKDIDKLSKQLEEGIYTLHSEEVQNIRSEQIQWFDEVDENGNILFGLAGAIPRMQEYFNSRSYSDPNQILSGKHSDIEIENLQISREGLSFSVVASQILGKVFFLNIEFIEMVNSFPFLKNGTITQFARQKNADEDDSMRFSVRLDRQLPDEEDPQDARFEEYTSWLSTQPSPTISQ